MIDISFIILTWNSDAYIEKCVGSIMPCLDGTDLAYEIFVIDNGSSDNTCAFLAELEQNYSDIVKPIYLDRNMGTTYSRNLGLKKATGRYLCIMDSDVELTPGLFEPLLKQLEHHPETGMVVPKILYPDQRLQKSTDRFPTFTRKVLRYFFLKQMEAREQAQAPGNRASEVDYAISAFWLFKRNVLEKTGLLDEKIFYSPEDVDYCLRVWKEGYRIQYIPDVTVIHHTQEISRGFKFNSAFFNHIKGLFYLFKKHGYFFRPPVFKP